MLVNSQNSFEEAEGQFMTLYYLIKDKFHKHGQRGFSFNLN